MPPPVPSWRAMPVVMIFSSAPAVTGTLNEVIQGCMKSKTQCPIGYIPLGSTNDFARGLGIPKDPEQAVDCIIHGEDLVCDVGSFNDKYFTYVAAFGAFTEISYETPQHFKNLLGHSAYLLNAISKLPKIRAYRMRIEYDGGVIEDEFLYGMVTILPPLRNFWLCPMFAGTTACLKSP